MLRQSEVKTKFEKIYIDTSGQFSLPYKNFNINHRDSLILVDNQGEKRFFRMNISKKEIPIELITKLITNSDETNSKETILHSDCHLFSSQFHTANPMRNQPNLELCSYKNLVCVLEK